MKKNNRKLRKLVSTINRRAGEAKKLSGRDIVSVDISDIRKNLKGKYLKKTREQINQGNWMFYSFKGGNKLTLKLRS
ncbi:MAG: hypothetical protein H0Z40_02280 [Desulfotomaculum sp.]|nr:hypothetical protein [Desulfotomaculum sp.]